MFQNKTNEKLPSNCCGKIKDSTQWSDISKLKRNDGRGQNHVANRTEQDYLDEELIPVIFGLQRIHDLAEQNFRDVTRQTFQYKQCNETTAINQINGAKKQLNNCYNKTMFFET